VALVIVAAVVVVVDSVVVVVVVIAVSVGSNAVDTWVVLSVATNDSTPVTSLAGGSFS